MKATYILIYPPILRSERYSSKLLGVAGGSQLPLGILYIASYLESKNYDVKFIDAEHEQLTEEMTVAKVKKFASEASKCYVGITATTVCFEHAVSLAEKIKQGLPDIKIILGGVHVSALPEEALSYECFDFGIIGEGEITSFELLECLNTKGDLEKVDGIVFRRNNKIIKTKPREFIKELDSLPFPARHLVKDLKGYVPVLCDYSTLPVTNIITSRGCPGLCTFCSHAVFGISYRERSAENIFEEIKEVIKKYRIREIHFNDDSFLLDKKRIYELFDKCREEKLKFKWSCFARVDNVTYDFLKYLKQNGCWHIAFGIESANKEVLKDIKKHISLENIEQVINWCREIGIKAKGHFMIGHPADTAESIDKTIEFALRVPFSDAVVSILTPMPGSAQYEKLLSETPHIKLDYKKIHGWLPILEPKGISGEALLVKQKEFYRRFYLRPHIIWNYALSLISLAFFKRFVTLFMNFLYVILPVENH